MSKRHRSSNGMFASFVPRRICSISLSHLPMWEGYSITSGRSILFLDRTSCLTILEETCEARLFKVWVEASWRFSLSCGFVGKVPNSIMYAQSLRRRWSRENGSFPNRFGVNPASTWASVHFAQWIPYQSSFRIPVSSRNRSIYPSPHHRPPRRLRSGCPVSGASAVGPAQKAY